MKSWFKAGLAGGLVLLFLTGWVGFSSEGGTRFYQAETDLIGAAESAIEQISQALTSVLFSWSKIQVGDRAGAEAHAHQAINIIEGQTGPNYDGEYGTAADGVGDGVGAINHAVSLLDKLQELEQNPESSNYIVAGENTLVFLRASVPHLLSALNLMISPEFKLDAVILQFREAQALLMAARASQEEKDRPTEGGARSILAWLNEMDGATAVDVQH